MTLMSAVDWGLQQDSKDGDSTQNLAESASDTTRPFSVIRRKMTVLTAVPLRVPGDDLGCGPARRSPHPRVCSDPYLFLYFVFTLLSVDNEWVEHGALLTSSLCSQCPTLELPAHGVPCEREVPVMLTTACNPVEATHFQRNSTCLDFL